jgi:hypothetical protein
MCFFISAEWTIGKKGAYLYFEKPKLQEVFLTKQSQFSQETMFKMLLF